MSEKQEIQDSRQDRVSDHSETDIAVIGLAGRFPRARDIDEFWCRIRDGVECISRFSDDELRESGVSEAELADPNYVKANSWLEDADCFDADFFGYSPLEAEAMDPQHRIFLECAWTALEHAGYGSGCDVPVGVFAGASMNTYIIRHLMLNPDVVSAVGAYQLMIGNDKDFVASRVAYKLGLTGPALTVQTACSTSLVAIQMACQSLLGYQSDVALAGGVSLYWPQKLGYLYQEGMILSPDGHCRPFDAKAQGTVGGQGVGVVVLKRLADALRDGDTVHAVVKGAAINNDGAHKVGFTAPSVDGQAEVIAMAHAMAGVDPETISLVEAHGTATPLGDPIEVAALTQAFGLHTDRKQFCWLGSVKSNLGHLDAAAGVAGFIKTVLALEHATIPKSLNFERPNPDIDLENSPFRVASTTTDWAADGRPRRAAVSSFGIGGTNAHAVLEEAPGSAPSVPARKWQPIVWSARTESALETATDKLAAAIRENPDRAIGDVAYTLQQGRKRFAHRRAVVVDSQGGAVDALQARSFRSSMQEMEGRPVVFLFSGQGSQYHGMAAALYRTERRFREIVDQCAALLDPEPGQGLVASLFESDAGGAPLADLTRTDIAQPALFTVEYALARLWMDWGVSPNAMIGHSIGEYVAACLAGVFSLEDAVHVVAQRGKLMQSMPPGSMIAVPASVNEIAGHIGDDISVAAINAEAFCSLSGTESAIAETERRLSEAGFETTRLHTSHAFHSQMMDPVLGEFAERVGEVQLREPELPFISNLTGDWITADEATDPSYWVRQLRGTVNFSAGMAELLRDSSRIFLEVGPGKSLATFARQAATGMRGVEVHTSLPHPREPVEADEFIVNSVARLWLAGADIDWTGFNAGGSHRRVPLPTYPFESKRYIAEAKVDVQNLAQSAPAAPSRSADVADWFYLPSWKRSIPDSCLNTERAAAEKATWIVFCDAQELAEMLREKLSPHALRILIVRSGPEFRCEGDTVFADPACREHYVKLVDQVDGLDAHPCRILHLWGLDLADTGPERVLEREFLSTLYLAQALGERAPAAVKLIIATSGLQSVNADDEVLPEKALALGPAKTIPLEYPTISCRNVDFLPSDSSENLPLLADRLIAETDIPGIAGVTYRDGYRWVQAFDRIRLDPVPELPDKLRVGGTYLITGGLGGIGLVLARFLAEALQANLVLVARSKLPDREQWDEYIDAGDPEDPTVSRLARIRELEDLGASLMVESADVADESAMRGVIDRSAARFGRIDGVIHAAGVGGGGIIQLKTRDMVESVLAPKVAGTLVLESVLQGQDLDFLLLCSSINSVYGGQSVVDYASANAFQDAFATARGAKNGWPVIAVNWDTWQEAGMAVDALAHLPAGMREARRQQIGEGIRNAEGVDAFKRLLGCGLSQVVVSTRDVRQIMDMFDAADRAKGSDTAESDDAGSASQARPAAAGRHERPELSGELVAPRNSDEDKLVAIWSSLLGMEEIGVEDDFFELGGHSLLGTRVLARIREEFSVNLPLQAIFEAPTVSALAARIQDLRLIADDGGEVPGEDSDDLEEIVF